MHRNLIGISADGIFKFRHAVGALAKLRPGKVMLLQGSDALMITGIGHSHVKLLVHTKAAALRTRRYPRRNASTARTRRWSSGAG